MSLYMKVGAYGEQKVLLPLELELGGCEPPSISAGNSACLVCKSRESSKPRCHLSAPFFPF